MGNQKQKWTSGEEEALRAGVAKHGPGKWKNILKDSEFALHLTNRSNIDLKDKWRNMIISTTQGSRDKFRASKVKAIIPVPPTDDEVVGHLCKIPQDVKTAQRYNALIFEALSTVKDSNGCDVSAIVGFIEQRLEVPQNFRRLLSSKLRRFVIQGKLEKIQNCYKIKDAALVTKTPTPKQKDVRLRPLQNSGPLISAATLEDTAMTAAYKIVDAENKSFVVAEAVKEAERVTKMAKDAESMLRLVEMIYEQCNVEHIHYLNACSHFC